jgi:hypothetical protein
MFLLRWLYGIILHPSFVILFSRVSFPSLYFDDLIASVESPRQWPRNVPPPWAMYAVIASVQLFFWGQLFIEWLQDQCWVGSLGPATMDTQGIQILPHPSPFIIALR